MNSNSTSSVNTDWGDNIVASISNGRSLSVVVNGEYFTIGDENPNFDAALKALREYDLEGLTAAVQPIKAIESVVSKVSNGVEISEGQVLWNGEPLHGVIVDRILDFKAKGHPIQALVNFLGNLLENPSNTAVNELYLFLESSVTPMPITDDGHFLAYKRVREDYRDVYSGKLDYSIGNVVEMPRNQVDDNRNNTCSRGLHFCSLDYLQSFSGARIVIVKINPADVVSIPSDYKNTKGRAWRLEVIGEHKGTDRQAAWDSHYYSNTTTNYDDDDGRDYYSDDDYSNDRDYQFNSVGHSTASAPITAVPTQNLGTGNKQSGKGFYPSRKEARNAAYYGSNLHVRDNGEFSATGRRWEVVG